MSSTFGGVMAGKAMKILAVDDDPEFLLMLEAVLHHLGYTNVTTAFSGPDALEMLTAANMPFDCFILDTQMPEMNGVELTREIRAIPLYRSTPIMMITVMTDRSWIEASFDAGAIDYLTKPIDSTEIRARLGVISELVKETRSAERERIARSEMRTVNRPSYGFFDGIPMKSVVGSIDLLSMQNYLKALGPFRAMSMAAFAVRVTNAREIYDLEGGYVFGEIMVDLAHCIPECLESTQIRLAYCGSGVFVCLVPRAQFVGVDVLSEKLQELLVEFEHVYSALDYRTPLVDLGMPATVGLGEIAAPQRIIDVAIANSSMNDASFFPSIWGQDALISVAARVSRL